MPVNARKPQKNQNLAPNIPSKTKVVVANLLGTAVNRGNRYEWQQIPASASKYQ